MSKVTENEESSRVKHVWHLQPLLVSIKKFKSLFLL